MSTLLVDTQLILWAAFQPARLSTKAANLLASRQQPLAFSLATLWEVAIKTSLGLADFSVRPEVLREGLFAQGFTEWPITAAHVARVAVLPWVHRDPFDRLLVAQAQQDGLTLLTSDALLKRYGRFVRVV